MYIVSTYPIAVALCFVTMLCWGSWANTQKLASREWRFQLFYWDYAIGVLLLALILGFTLGSTGEYGRPLAADLHQAEMRWLGSAFFGGVIFNLSNILLVAAIDIAGMAVAFPVGIGLALVLGVVVNYEGPGKANPLLLFAGVAFIVAAILLDALAYRRVPGQAKGVSAKGLILAIACGILMGFFYRFVARSMSSESRHFVTLDAGKMGPYAAVFFFSIGMLISNLVFNTLIMVRPFRGSPLRAVDYLRGTASQHLVGVLGGAIWGVGNLFSFIAFGIAGPAISYGLGQGATLVAALWGVFVWREFRNAPRGTGLLLALMFAGYVIGLTLVIAARVG